MVSVIKKTLGAWLTLVVWISGLAALQWPRLQRQLATTELSPQAVEAQEAVLRDRLTLWRTMPVFGFDNLVADWAYLNFFQYFGHREARQMTGYTALPDFFAVMVQRDPYFSRPYRYLSSSVTLFAGQPQETIRLLEQALAQVTPRFPDDAFWLWRYKAMDELLFLGEIDAAIQSLEQNAEWASQSLDPQASRHAASARSLAEFLRRDPDSRQVQASGWTMIWGNAINEEVRHYAERQLEALGYRVIREGTSLRLEDTMTQP